MSDALAELRQRLGAVSDLRSTLALLEWGSDGDDAAGRGGGACRPPPTVERIAHERFIDDRIGSLVEELRGLEESLPYDSDDACLIRVTRRDWEKARRNPADLAAALAEARRRAWRRGSSHGRRTLRSVPAVARPAARPEAEYIACFDTGDDPYDVLLDDFEPGTTTAEVREVFARLKEELVPLIAAVGDARPGLGDGPFPEAAQEELGLSVMSAFGFDELSFRLDTAVHPFCSSFATSDIRVTTRYAEHDLESLFSCMHEIGHGLYERGVSLTLERHRSPPAARPACTRAKAGCGRTSSGARPASVAGSIRSSWRRSPRRSAASRRRGSTRP